MLLDQSNDPIFLVKVPSGRFLSVSESACRQIGYSEGECLSKTIYDLLPGNRKELEEIFSGRTESVVFDALIARRGGEKTPCEVNMHIVRLGSNVYVVAVARDITEHRRAEEELRKSEEKFRQLSDCSPMPMASYNTAGNILYLNKKLTETYGYTLKDTRTLSGWWLLAYPDPGYRQKVKKRWTLHVEKALGGSGEIEPMEAMVTCKDGSIRHVEFYGTAIGGQIIVILQDITQRKQAEEALLESEEKFRALAESSSAAIFIYQGDRYMWTNQASEKITGYPEDELLKLRISDIIHPDLREEVLKRALRRQHGEQEPPQYETRIVTKGGEVKWILLSAGRIMYRGKPAGVATLLDITDRKRAEERLRFTQFAIDRAQDEAFWTTSDGHFIYVNDAACQALGYTREELLKLSVPDIDPLKPPMAFGRQWQVLKEQGSTRFESLHRAKNGRIYPVEIRENYVVFDGKEYNCAFATDITERKRAEEARRDAKAQAELYLDLMSHDLTNMNQALMGYLEIIEISIASGKLDKGLVNSSMEIINRSSRMIDDVKKLTAAQAGKVPGREVNVCDMLAAIKARYSSAQGRPVTINYTPGSDCLVRADDLLADVLVNLTENAIRHSRGPVTIDLAMEKVLIEGKEWYEITVADTGPGIPDDLKKKIFKPLNESGEKTVRRGFGLYLVRTLVDHYRGRVWVEDRVPGDHTKGSIFVVLLPASKGHEPRQHASPG